MQQVRQVEGTQQAVTEYTLEKKHQTLTGIFCDIGRKTLGKFKGRINGNIESLNNFVWSINARF